MNEALERDIVSYVDEHFVLLSSPTIYLGGWVNEDKVYLDLSLNIDDKKEAMSVANNNNQVAIFDLNSKIWIQVDKSSAMM
jgi:hypothetical protein